MFDSVFGKTWTTTEALLASSTETDANFFGDPAVNIKDLTLKPTDLNKDNAYIKLSVEYNYLFVPNSNDETCFVDT